MNKTTKEKMNPEGVLDASRQLVIHSYCDANIRELLHDILDNETLTDGQLAQAASCYTMAHITRQMQPANEEPAFWPFAPSLWLPFPGDREMELAIAQVLIALEAIRLNDLKTDKEE